MSSRTLQAKKQKRKPPEQKPAMLGSEHAVASRDLDFQGNDRAAGAIAELLGGNLRLPAHGARGVLNGVVEFADSDGHERELDLLRVRWLLAAKSIRRTA